jgi:hypothetical protein
VVFGFENYAIVDVIEANKECKVDEGDSLCSLICCMRESYNRWQNAKCSNNRRAAEFEGQFWRVSAIATLAYVSLSCGDTKGVEGYVAEAKKVAGCDDCDCGGEKGKLVVGLCGASVTGEVDVTGGDGITITEGGVINIDEVWLTAFVNNLLANIDLSGLFSQVATNVSDIAALNAALENISVRFTNHNILSFSYRFSWTANTLTDNRNAEGFVTDAFVQKMNGTGVSGWIENPRIVWVNAATSTAPAEIEVRLVGLEGLLPTTAFNNLNVVAQLVGRGAGATNTLATVTPVVFAIGTGGENTPLRFRVRFFVDNIGYVSQSYVSASTNNIGGDVHLSFFVTGKN